METETETEIIRWFEEVAEDAGRTQTETLRRILEENCGVEYLRRYLSCSPQEVISSGDYRQSTYCHLLLGLFFSHDVDYITSAFAYSIVQALASFEDLYAEICHDITFGTLSPRITLPVVRKAVLQIIRPNPPLASRIHFICSQLQQANWAAMIPALWPSAKYVCSIMTGSMQPYTKKLRHYGGGLPLVSADYGSTESWIGVNVDPSLPPEKVTFAVVPSFSYFEFIPVHKPDCTSIISDSSISSSSSSHRDHLIEDDPVTLSQVKVGLQYELVLTTFTGLYRYRLGDIVEVSGFHKGTPKLSFVCRRNLILTINIDKNTEKDLQLVVERASQVLSLRGGELVDFTSHAVAGDVAADNEQGHYVVYWEIKGEVEDRVLEECCGEMDRSFVDHGYVVSRRCGSIGPLELRVVEGGTFKKILDYFVEKGGALSQFKTPRCTSNSVLLDILNAATTRTFYSKAYN